MDSRKQLQARLSGAMTALVTPFREGDVDFARLRLQAERQIAGGISGLIPVGTTGESPTLEFDEHERVIATIVEVAARRVPVLAGVGANSTKEALHLHKFALSAGADYGLSVNPYYNKPTQEGLYRHFMTLADECPLPIVLYNIPGRTGITMTPATAARLAAHPNIVAIKEATGSLDIATEISTLCDLVMLSGDDSLTLPLMAVGATGVISVISNLLPDVVSSMVKLAVGGPKESAEARTIHRKMFPLIKGLFADGNPVGVKHAMHVTGLDAGEMRLPLVEASSGVKKQIEDALAASGLAVMPLGRLRPVSV